MTQQSLAEVPEYNDKSLRDFGDSIAPVLLISSNDKLLNVGMKTFGSHYKVMAIGRLNSFNYSSLDMPLKAIVLDDTVSQNDTIKILHALGNNAYNKNLPIIGLTSAINSDLAAILGDWDNAEIISRPFSRKKLVNGLSSLLNKKVRDRWTKIDAVNKMAMEGCFTLFNSIPDTIANGGNVIFSDIKENTNPIIESIQMGVSRELLDSLVGFDGYTFSHCLKLSVLLTKFGDNIGIKGDDLKILAAGGIVHDLGKLEIPFDVLNKPGKLDAEEWAIMKSHVTKTSHILRTRSDVPEDIMVIAEKHHEKLDGTGYPNGLKGIQINDLARIAAIIDIFSALTDDRPYKNAMSIEKTFKIMRSMTGHIDQHFLSLFIESTLDNMSVEMH